MEKSKQFSNECLLLSNIFFSFSQKIDIQNDLG